MFLHIASNNLYTSKTLTHLLNTSLENKSIDNYWINKLKLSPVVNNSTLVLFETEEIIIKNEELSYFNKVSANNEVVEFTVLLSIYNILLERYFETVHFIASSGLAKNEHTLIYKFDATKGATFKECLHKVKGEIQEVFKYSNFSERSIGRTSFCDFTSFGFSYNNNFDAEKSDFPFYLNINKKEGGLSISISYDENFTTKYIANHFVRTIKRWLLNLESYIQEEVSKLPIISEEEIQEVLYSFNDTEVDYPKDKTIVDLFEEQVEKTPDHIAIVFEDVALTYKNLNEQANQLAQYLSETYTIQPNDLIGVKLERSEKLLAAILGVLKSGAAYVPIDTNYPEERINYIERDSNCKIVIDAKTLEDFSVFKDKYSIENLQSTTTSNHLAYVIYTSGTTGKPKGVMIMHQNAVAMLSWASNEFDAKNFDVVYAVTSHCFDLSVYEFFYPLSLGKKIKLLGNSLAIGDELHLDKKVLINTVPSSIRSLLESGISLENAAYINLAGEPFPVDIAKKLLTTNATIRNLYGPSEDTTYSTIHTLSKEEEYTISIPIGRPISNTQAYVLNENLEPLPIGIIGKLYLSGAGITKGYLNRPDLTNEKFIKCPFDTEKLMYDTGDLVKWTPSGTLEFFGRKDHQVKLRGYRIELGEIENEISQFSEDIQSVVTVLKTVNNAEVLVGYYVSKKAIDKRSLRTYLEAKLPSYMVPAYLLTINRIPLTPNGKIDKQALPNVTSEDITRSTYVAPRNEVEEQLVNIWEEIIGIKGIGIKDNFFELGGHSLMISQMFNAVHKLMDKRISFKVLYSDPTIKGISELLQKDVFVAIAKAPISDSYPLTPSQKRLWLLSQIGVDSKAYQITGALSLKGDVHVEYFAKAFNYVVNRHDILRTYFKNNEEGVLRQYIIPESDFEYKLSVKDFTQSENPDNSAKEYIQECQGENYDLSKGPLLMASLLKISNNNFVFFLSMHHIISDGWSLEILTSEIIESYKQSLEGKLVSLPDLSIQFQDYAVWLNEASKKEKQNQAQAYWLNVFQGELPVLQLPSYVSRPLIKTYTGKTLSYQYSKETLEQLKDFSRNHKVTLFMTLMTAVKSLLSKYTNQEDIIIGTPVAGREHPDLESQIGLYLNTLAIRTSIEAENSFLEVLLNEKKQLLEAYSHQDYPFDQLVSQLNLKRDTSRSPLFDVMVVLQNQRQLAGFNNREELANVTIDEFRIERETSQFDLSLTFIENEDELLVEASYNTDLYEASFVKGIFSHLENLMSQILEVPEIAIEEIDLLTKEEKRTVLKKFNDTKVAFDVSKTVIDLYKKQVSKTPDAIAIVFEGTHISYRELDEKSNQLAHYLLQNHEIKQEDLVAVRLERSEWLIISLLAILKSGGAYVPIDNEYPETRIQYIIEDAKTNVVIDVAFINNFQKVNNLPVHSPEILVTPSNLAYVIYTSGSTGKPKGVMIEHKSLLNLCVWYNEVYDLDALSNVTLYAGVGFDASVWEIFPGLLFGATLYPINDNEIRLNTSRLASFFRDNKITHAYVPSKICQNFIEEGITNLNTKILAGGEALKYSKKTTLQIYNNYGPTESTVVSTYLNCKDVYKDNIPIGIPIDNTEIYVLSQNLKLQPIGVIGELCISGAGLSRGYLNSPELTQEKFITHPFKKGERLYKTGDLARWLPDGNLEFSGRNDEQIKIRGNRIELGEIEYAILGYSEDIHQVIVLQKEVNQEKVLVAYYTTSQPIDKIQLREYLASELPIYMMPGYFIEIDTIPLTANGKLNRSKLPEIVKSDIIRREYVTPTNSVEEDVVVIWKNLLEIDEIGITDDFFELGGHSLLLNKLINEYHRAFNKEISLKEIYSNATPKYHAKLLAETTITGFNSIEHIDHQEHYKLSPSQLRFWLLYKIQGKSKEFNIYSDLTLPTNVNVNVFEAAFNELLKRHEILRTVFIEDNSLPKQKVLSHEFIKIPQYDMNALAEAKDAVYNHEFELDMFPLFKIALVKEENDSSLLFNIHHIICDGWSIGIIHKELMDIYEVLLSETEMVVGTPNVQYKDYSYWVNDLLSNDDRMTSQLDYWKEKLAGEIPYLQLPLDYAVEVKSSETKSAYYKVFLENELKHKIVALSVKNKCSVFSVFAATLKIFLNRLTSEEDIVIGIPAANRNHHQLKNMLGCFLNTLMLRDTLDTNASFQDFLLNANQTLIDGLANQNYPFESVLEELNIPRDQNRFPLSSVFLNMLDFDAKSSETITDFNFQHGNIDASPKFDFECYLKSYENGYEINCVYPSGQFKEETIKYWIDTYTSVIDQAVSNPSEIINQFTVFEELIPQVEEPRPTNTFDLFEKNEIHQSIVQRFEKQVLKFPDRIAVKCRDKCITYKDLNTRANHLGKTIIQETNTAHQRVALLLHHDEHAVIGMLAALKSGNSYVPIDPGSPATRIQYIIEDSGCNVLICNQETLDKATQLKKDIPNLKVLSFSSDEILPETANLHVEIDCLNEAYILYTSGSTGTPKGVIQNQRNVLHFIRVYTNNTHISNEDTLSVFSTYTFDASVKDIYGAVLNGASVGIYDISEEGLHNLPHWLQSQNVTIIHMVPTIYRYFAKELKDDEVLETVRIIDLGGEPCFKSDFEIFKKHFSKKAFIINDYGPTESTIVSQKFLSHESVITRNHISLGKAVVETEVYIADENNNKKGIYQEGEIVFKSDYLSLGYLNRKELTDNVFLSASDQSSKRIYKSGDIGRMLPSGEIEFVGRKDTQVKINGLRIELSEIEYHLEQIQDIKKAVVLLTNIRDRSFITAYIKGENSLEPNEIKSLLKSVLPKYMIPNIYIRIEEFQLTRTGKIDRKSLPSPQESDLKSTKYVAPKNQVEEKLVELWADVLKLEETSIGTQDNFFELGGNSLQAVMLINKINKIYNTSYSIANLYESLSVENLSVLLDFSLNQNNDTDAIDENEDDDQDEFIL